MFNVLNKKGLLIISDIERRILNIIQKDFSSSLTPFKKMADELGIQEDEFLARVEQLKSKGLLTRVGPFFNMDKTSGHISLVAMKVPEERFEEICELVNSFEEVAHNYKRDNDFNMWFVISGVSKNAVKEVLARIEGLTGLETYDFPKLKEFVLDLYLEVREQ